MKKLQPFLVTLFVLSLTLQDGQTATNNLSRLDRTNLLLAHSRSGEVRMGKTISHWQRRRAETLKGMQEVMGELPGKSKRCPLEMKVEEETDCGSFVRRLISYSAEPGGRTPAYLLVPKKALEKKVKLPAVLALHPTEMKLGHKVVVGLGGKENRNYAQELAERGYVVLAPSYPLMADYQPDLKALNYQSGTMKAIWDNIRGMDLLDSLPYVKAKRYGAIGHSLGGHNTIYTAVFDERIKVAVSSCGFDSFLDYKNGDIRGWTQERYMPKIAKYPLAEIPFDFYELVGALAPRVFFVNAPKNDSNFKWQSVDKIIDAATPVFRLYGAEENLRVEHPDCAHDFPDDIRAMSYTIMDKHLK